MSRGPTSLALSRPRPYSRSHPSRCSIPVPSKPRLSRPSSATGETWSRPFPSTSLLLYESLSSSCLFTKQGNLRLNPVLLKPALSNHRPPPLYFPNPFIPLILAQNAWLLQPALFSLSPWIITDPSSPRGQAAAASAPPFKTHLIPPPIGPNSHLPQPRIWLGSFHRAPLLRGSPFRAESIRPTPFSDA